VKPAEGFHGRDITPLLKNPIAKWPHPCLYEHTGDVYGDDVTKVLQSDPTKAIYQKVPWYTAVILDDWKYIRYLQPGVADELYNLRNDPDELQNLAREARSADRLATLRTALAAELKRTAAPAVLLPPEK
jgi:arylsulfatase A-like enzyme